MAHLCGDNRVWDSRFDWRACSAYNHAHKQLHPSCITHLPVRCRHEDQLRCSSLSSDHKPEDASERRRVEAAGGEVVFNGCYRVQHEDVRELARS